MSSSRDPGGTPGRGSSFSALFARLELHQLKDPVEVLFSGELDDDLSLALADVDFCSGVEETGQALGQLHRLGG